MKFQGNVFVVTGGASGLGGATAAMIVAQGGKVILADVNADAGKAHAASLGAAAQFLKCDVTREEDGKAVIDAALAAGTLRGLVNCAGIAIGQKTVGRDGPHPLDAFQRVIMINLVGTFNMIRLAATAMARQDPLPNGERGAMDPGALGSHDRRVVLPRERHRFDVGSDDLGVAAERRHQPLERLPHTRVQPALQPEAGNAQPRTTLLASGPAWSQVQDSGRAPCKGIAP